MNNHDQLQEALYNTGDDFFVEDVHYKSINDKKVRSFSIKEYLHLILTNAIFNYSPCKDLLDVFDENHKPKMGDWADCTKKWLALSAEPFQLVSEISTELF